MHTQNLYQKAIRFAAQKHAGQGQTITGTILPYVVHLSNVAMEILLAAPHSPGFDIDFAVQLALLHDTLEDTNTTIQELESEFGRDIAEGVQALTKNEALPKPMQMADSLQRIKTLRKEVWAVKLADRITNLQPAPPHWDDARINAYRLEALEILSALEGGNSYLEKRLSQKIGQYGL